MNYADLWTLRRLILESLYNVQDQSDGEAAF